MNFPNMHPLYARGSAAIARADVILGLELLSIPLVLGSPVGVQVLSTWLYRVGIGAETDYAAVAVVAVVMLVAITGLVWLQVRLTGQERRSQPLPPVCSAHECVVRG